MVRPSIHTIAALSLLGCGVEPTPTYAEVQAIFNTRCSGVSCHIGDPSLAAGLDLDISVSYQSLVNVPALQNPSRRLVAPGRAAESYLFCKIDPGCGPIVGLRMPLENTITASELDTIRRWINGGALNTLDNTPPTFDGIAAALPSSNSSVALLWAAASDDLTPGEQIVYDIFLSDTSGGFDFTAPAATSAPGVTSFEVTGLSAGSTTFFAVRAKDSAGNTDNNTAEASAAPLEGNDIDPPDFAGLSAAVGSSPSTIALSWSPATDLDTNVNPNPTPSNQLVYLIFQASSAGAQNFGTPTFTTLPGATSFEVTGLSSGETLFFVVRARDLFGNIDQNTIEQSATTTAATISFASQIQPIFTASCTGAGCHSGAAPAKRLDLSTAARSFADLVNIASEECSATKRVAPGDPDNSYLVQKLIGTGPCFSGNRMPKADTALPAAEQNLIRTWIAEGALNN